MKVAIVNDYDGHVNCMEWNADNAARLIEVLAEAPIDRVRLMFNGHLADEEEEKRLVAEFLAEPRDQAWLERAADFVNNNFGGRSNSNMVNVLEPEKATSRQTIGYWLT